MDVQLIFLLIVRFIVTYSLTTVRKVPVKSGSSISIPCFYATKYRSNVKYLCRGYNWNSCKDVVRTDKPQTGKFSISDYPHEGLFNVTIKSLGKQDAYNWCNVEINRGGDDGVYFELAVTNGELSLSVDNQHMETFVGETLTINCYHNDNGRMKWCKYGDGHCVMESGQTDKASKSINNIKKMFTVNLTAETTTSTGWYYFDNGNFQMPVHVKVREKRSTEKTPTENQNDKERNDSHDLLFYIIPLAILIITVMAALLIWFLYARHKRVKAQSPLQNDEGEVTYTTIEHKKKTGGQTEEQGAGDVTYSTLAYNGGSPA